MIIPYDRLPKETLHAVIESFINREGTDYGVEEISLADKIEQVENQLKRGDVVISFDTATESINIMSRADAEELERLIAQQSAQQ